jgi:ribonuclease D
LAEELRQYDVAKLYDDRAAEEQYTRVKGTGRLSRRDMAIVRELATWREKEAQQADRPRAWIIRDDTLVQIARRKPRSPGGDRHASPHHQQSKHPSVIPADAGIQTGSRVDLDPGLRRGDGRTP